MKGKIGEKFDKFLGFSSWFEIQVSSNMCLTRLLSLSAGARCLTSKGLGFRLWSNQHWTPVNCRFVPVRAGSHQLCPACGLFKQVSNLIAPAPAV